MDKAAYLQGFRERCSRETCSSALLKHAEDSGILGKAMDLPIVRDAATKQISYRASQIAKVMKDLGLLHTQVEGADSVR